MSEIKIGAEVTAAENSRSELRVLLVEDSPTDAELIVRELKKGFEVSFTLAQTADQFRRALAQNRPDVVLADYNLGNWRGLEALEILQGEGRDIPVIVVTGALGDAKAVDCLRQGATDYVLKDSLARLPEAIRRALHEKQLRKGKKMAEDYLAMKMEELARSNAELEQFAYVASHDLQEPLRMIANYTQLLAERYRGKLDEQADKYIHYAVDGATRMQAMIQDLLTYSRAGRHENNLHRADSNKALEQALKNLQAAIKESGAVVKYDPLPTVTGNAIQMTQLFQNLIANAIKFHGREAPVVLISAEEKGGDWVFSVVDNGIGIAPEYAKVIFSIFQRLHTRSEYSGNGIGLAVCKKIVERNGGRIWLESKEGQGSTFKFTVPVRAAVEDGATVPQMPEQSGNGNAAHA